MQLIRPWLLIGKYHETINRNLLVQAKIDALLHLAAPIEPPGITSLYLPINDGEPLKASTLRRGVDFVLAEHSAGRTVLVACGAGISRSTTFAIAALKEAEERSLLEAAEIIRRAHPAGMPHMALWSSLCMYYDEPHDYLELIRAGEPYS